MASNSNGSSHKTPQKPQFKSGTLVEVSSDDEGFRGSWYIGKVIKRASSKNPDEYLVEYQKLFEDEAGKKPLKENLEWAQLRPLAPKEKKRKFRFGEKVDAYHNDGWWEGSITNECDDGKFAVFFRGTREQIEFDEEDLRLHREWANGEWKPPLEGIQEEKKQKVEETVTVKDEEEDDEESMDEVSLSSKPGVESNDSVDEEFSKGMQVEVSSDEEGFEGAWFGGTIVEVVGKGRYLIEYTALRTEDDTGFLREEIASGYIRPAPPETIVVDRFKLLDEVDALYNDGWWVGVISKVLSDCKYIVYFRESKEELMFKHSDLRLHQDWIAGQWITPSLV
ncbi:protein AGENET DOMAIN (AGD)-CONTAINING P1 isoform X2 [Euphorbia lathyris]|uniref:protein AGENET DOMAIN (AGD)-CONTAINING P1 isoform X2 n=1 Tax=Euphorbia lathyris TaxID=212925 RepID=UPI0033144B62